MVARARSVRLDLAALSRELAALIDLPLEGPDRLEHIDLRLRIPLDPAEARGKPSDDPLLAALLKELHTARRESGLFQDGRAHCFQCRSNDCVHAVPRDSRQVFLAYTATGKPAWRELTTACLEWNEPRVDVLHGDPPGVVAVHRHVDELTDEMIEGFGRGERGYRLLGQVAFGYLVLRDGERGALTLQAVGTRRSGAPLALYLNVIGLERTMAGRRGYPEWWERRALRETVREARADLQALALRLRARRKGPIAQELSEGVAAVLGRLRSSLERLYRPQGHRTRHAVARLLQKDRPTHAALADAERAPDEKVLYEPDRATVIVLGPKGRVHVFAEDGRHVTSLHQQRDAIDRKLDRKQWVPCDSDRRERFRQAVAALRKPRR